MMNVCGLCATFNKIDTKDCRYFVSQAVDEPCCAIFRICPLGGLVHECFRGCESFVPTKTFYCARYECIVKTEACLDKQLYSEESCEECTQGKVVIDTMRGVRWSELK